MSLFAELLDIVQQPNTVHRRVWDELRPWLQKLAASAGPKWIPRLGAGITCEQRFLAHGAPHRCKLSAVSLCLVCKRPTCLQHALVDAESAEVVCQACVGIAIKELGPKIAAAFAAARNGAEQHKLEEEMRWARETLGVTEHDDWETVRSKHRKLSAKWHPDRHRTAAAKRSAEAKFKAVQRAFDVLSRDHERKAA